jgi:hypothetical protein
VNGAAPTAGFKRYIGGSNNIFNTTGLPQLSGSMGFSPTMTGNIGVGTYTFRGPVSASSWNISSNLNNGTINIGQNASQNAQGLTSGLTMQTNIIPGTVTIIANQASFTGSSTIFVNNMVVGGATLTLNQSAATLTNNIINDSGFALTSNYFSSSAGLGSINVNRNNIIGASNTLVITGSQPAGTTNATAYNENFIGGGSNTIFVDVSTARVSATTAYHSALRNIIYGTNLTVTGSSASGDTTSYGSAFFGRYNANDAIRNKTSDVVFAVGTGTSTSNRKTGFLIDSGSNTFVEGTLNVSGATSLNGNLNITGSLTASLQQGYVYVGNASGITTTVATSSFITAPIDTGSFVTTSSFNDYTASQQLLNTTFATTGSNSFNGSQTITGSLLVKGNTTFVTQDNVSSNIVLGLDSMFNSTNATDSIAIGNNALRYSSGSQQNIAIGKNALLITSASNNFALGNEALSSNTTGNQNVALGIGALSSNKTGNKNLAIGNDAGIQASGSQNIFIGASSGQYITGSNNTIIGSFTSTAGTVLNDNIILADGSGNVKAQYSSSAWSLHNEIKLNVGSDKPADIVSVLNGNATVNNSLATTSSIILVTTQQTLGGTQYPAIVDNKTAGSFDIKTNQANTIKVAYLIINPTA